MEKIIEEVQKGIGQLDRQKMTESAIKIATFALKTFSGELLDKALNISKSIIDFEDKLKGGEINDK